MGDDHQDHRGLEVIESHVRGCVARSEAEARFAEAEVAFMDGA
jgi:hypothetical protein